MDEKEFDFGHLTKEQALYLHKKLWNTLADKILEWKRPVEKWEIFDLYDWPKADADCWCCKYSKTCHSCPIDWENFAGICDWVGSPYKKWKDKMNIYRRTRRVKISREDLEELYKYARKVANLPERK